ncbi:Conserved_hypothetical protein [Hexamita inflata]|uniref:Uncharacterized protein n=1 Tax=Hexamita inflata TaxID=28002 RepID=A0ABP1HY96_9EUKA
MSTQSQPRVAANTDKSSATTEEFRKKQLEMWFSCKDTEFTRANQVTLRRSRDIRSTDAQARVYHDFSLLQYACVFDNIKILEEVYSFEKDFVTSEEIQLFKNNETIIVPKNSTPLMITIVCNSTKCVNYLLKDLTLQDVRIPLNDLHESSVVLAARLPGYQAAQLALQNSILQQKEFHFQTEESQNILNVACENKNSFLMHLFTKLLATPRADCLFKFAMTCKVQTSPECQQYLEVLQRFGVQKIIADKLYDQPQYIELLKSYLGPKYEQFMTDLEDKDKVTNQQKQFAIKYKSEANDSLKIKQNQQKFTINRKPTYDFDSAQQKPVKPFELQAKHVVADYDDSPDPEEVKFVKPPMSEKFNLFDQAGESLIPILISQYSNTFQPSRPEQLAAARNFASDDRVVPLEQSQINWFNVCKDGNLQLCKSMSRVHCGEVDTRPTDAEKLIYNGFSGIHYATVFGRWQIVQYLLQYEALATTKARVILKAPGVGPDRAVIVPLQSNAIQLACYCNQVQIVKMIVDSLVTPRNVYIDPIQQAFSKKNAPLTVNKQKLILTQKNELEQTALAVMAQCKIISSELSKEVERGDYILQLCLDQLDSSNILDFNDQFVVQNAYLFNNTHVLKTVRTELLTNPCNKMNAKTYAQLLFKVYDLLQDMKNSEECAEILPSLPITDEVKAEAELIQMLIEAQYFVNRIKEDENAEKKENKNQEHLEETQRFQKWFKKTFEKHADKIETTNAETAKHLEELNKPRYVESFGNDLFVCKRKSEIPAHDDLEYLNSVVQAQDLSYYFDCVIMGFETFVAQEHEKYTRKIDRRQTRKDIINGFTALMYACYYGHTNIVKLLLEKEFDVEQGIEQGSQGIKQEDRVCGQIKVDVDRNHIYVVKGYMSCLQAAILSQKKQSSEIIDYISQVAAKNLEIASMIFRNHKQTSVILKMAIIANNEHILKNNLVREYETQHIYQQLRDLPLTCSILYKICEYQSVAGLKFLQEIILADATTTRTTESDLPMQTRQQIESELLFSLQLCCLQRLDNKCPLDWIKRKSSQQKTNETAIKFINDLTNDAIMRALNLDGDLVCERLLQEYFGEEFENIKETHKSKGQILSGEVVHNIEQNGLEELEQSNFFINDHQINRLTFEPIQKLNEVDVWFEMCKRGNLQQVQAIARNFYGRRELRYNNYDQDIHQGFTGLMYATLFNTLDVILFLMDFEGMLNMEQDALVRTESGAFVIPAGCTPQHLASVVADQFVIDAFFQFYEQHDYELATEISVSRFLIIHGKRVNQQQLLKDFPIDHQLLRLAVQYSRVEFLNVMGDMSQTEDYFQDFYEQLFQLFEFNHQRLTINDLILQLPSQTYAKLNKRDVQETIVFVEQAIKKVLIVMIQQEMLEDNASLINEFYKAPDAVERILESFKTLSEPKVVHEEQIDAIGKAQFFRVQDDQILTQPVAMGLSMQSDLQNEWFRACRENDMAFIHTNFKQMKTLRDGRQSSFINQTHTGFCGLHYALVYKAEDAFNFLFDFEWNVVTGSDVIINGDQGRYFVPARSTILHLIAMVRNERFLKLMKQKPQVEGLVNARNRVGVPPIELFAGQNYCEQFIYDMYMFNFNDEQMRAEADEIMHQCFEHCCKADNVQFARFCLLNQNLYQSSLYKHVFSIWKQEEHNDAEKQFMKLQNDALEYALLYRMEEQWRRMLEEHFGAEKADVEAEYQNLKIWTAEQYEIVEDEKMFDGPQSVIVEGQQNIREPKVLKYLRDTRQNEEQRKWFQAAKTGDVEYIKKHMHLVGLQDESLTNYKTKTYTQFTGLMYAIVFNQLEVIKILTKHELLIYANSKNLVEIPNDDDDLPEEEKIATKKYYLFRVAYSIILAIVSHKYEIFDYFISELKTQEEMLYNQFTYETMVTVDFKIPYSYMIKLMSLTSFNLLRIVLVMQKDSHMKYLMEYTCGEDKPKLEYNIIKTCKLDEQIFKQMLSLLDDQSIDQWRELGQHTSALIDKSIAFGLDNSFDEEVNSYLYKIYGESLNQKIRDYRSNKFQSDIVDDMDVVIHNSYIVPEEQIKDIDEIVETEDQKQKHADLDTYLEAVKINDIHKTKRVMLNHVMQVDVRQTNSELQIYKGFNGLHYAALMNNVSMIGVLWNHEKMALTKEDVIIDALGTGFGNKFFLSKGSNALMIAALLDNKESVQIILQLIQADRDLEKFYQRPNFRGVNNLYIASVCWRCASGQLMFQSKMLSTQLRQITFITDPRAIETIKIMLYTNCSFGAKILYDMSQTDLQFKQWFYSVALSYDFVELTKCHQKQQYGSPAEKEFIQNWLDMIYEDALNYGLKQMTEINWNRFVSANLKSLKSIVTKQFNYCRSVCVRNGQIEIYDDLLMQQTQETQRQYEIENQVAKATGTMTRTINAQGKGKFNDSLNQTDISNQQEYAKLPQQQILAQPQIALKSPPKVLGSEKLRDNTKFEEMQQLWYEIEAGK